MKKAINITPLILTLSLCLILLSCHKNAVFNTHKNVCQDAVYKKDMQTFPGKLECEYYNLGGEGVAYHGF